MAVEHDGVFALLVSECIAVALWRNCDIGREMAAASYLTEFRCRVLRGSGEGTVDGVGEVRFVDELGFAFGWIASEPRLMERASHAVTSHGRLWVIDPVADESALWRARELGEPAGVVQLLDRHRRDCRAVAEQLRVPHYELPEQPPPGAPFEVLPLLRQRWWREVALCYPEQRTLVCADAVGTAQYYRAPGERLVSRCCYE